MIGKPEWFTYRTFGWGIAPKTWQGWVYVAVLVLLAVFVSALPFGEATKMWLLGIFIGVFVLDALHIMMQLPKVHDERQNYHQLLVERNVSFGAIAALIGVAIYQTYMVGDPAFAASIPFDWSIMVVIIAMVVVKSASSLYVKYWM